MRFRYALLTLFCGGMWGTGHAQVAAPTDSITGALRQRLLQEPLAPLVRVVAVRAQLAEGLRQDQPRQVPQLLAYLASTVPDSVTAVQPYEAWALLAAAADFDGLLRRVAADNPFDARRQNTRPAQPPRDGLFELTQGYLARHLPALQAQARTARRPAEDSAFLQLALPVLAGQRDDASSKELNDNLQRFALRYPRSEYGYWAQRLIRPTYEPSRFRYGLDFHSGTGFFTGGLNEAFRPRFNFGHGFEFGWDRYMLYLRNYIGWAEARTDYAYDGRTWPAGQTLNYYVPEISVGYRLLDSKRLLLTPFAGVSWCNFAPPTNDARNNPALELDVTMRHPLTAGLNLDVLLWKTQSGPELGAWMLKIRSGVRATEAPLRPETRGTLFYLDIGIGGFGQMMRRKALTP